MLTKIIKQKWRNAVRSKNYENIVEAMFLFKYVRQIVGASVYTIGICDRGGQVSSRFSRLGFVCFALWYLSYFYSVLMIYCYDQSIIRLLYATKLQRYGDEVERIFTLIFVLYTMWKLPFDMGQSCRYVQLLVDIDKAIQRLGEPINYSKYVRLGFHIIAAEILIIFARLLSMWSSLANLNISLPFSKAFQVVFSDSMALSTTVQYCMYLWLLMDRYKIVNKILESVDSNLKCGELFVVRNKQTGSLENTLHIQDRCTSERIKSCAKIYGMLHEASEMANKKFGLALALTMYINLVLIVLYLFYFMEANASGLFHDFQKYVDFLIYVFSQISFAFGIIYLNIYFSENTVREAKITSFLTHNIINSEANPLVRTEAVHLSLQVIHQIPIFTARGLTKIDYVLLLEGFRAVITFLVMLLQFAADTR